jgi:hypothetical protein
LRQQSENKVQLDLRKLESRDLDEICTNVDQILQALLNSNAKSFDRKIHDLVLENAGLENAIIGHQNELQ